MAEKKKAAAKPKAEKKVETPEPEIEEVGVGLHPPNRRAGYEKKAEVAKPVGHEPNRRKGVEKAEVVSDPVGHKENRRAYPRKGW